MQSVAVFCSASDGLPEVTQELARDLGRLCGERGIRVVYGGGARGLMSAVAWAAHDAGGAVCGFMLDALRTREGANVRVGELHFVNSLEERKLAILREAQAVIALPGGIGTLDELTQVLTLDDIGLAHKPVCLCDADGFWDPFFGMIEQFDAYGVIRPPLRRDLMRAKGAAEALERCAAALAGRAVQAPAAVIEVVTAPVTAAVT